MLSTDGNQGYDERAKLYAVLPILNVFDVYVRRQCTAVILRQICKFTSIISMGLFCEGGSLKSLHTLSNMNVLYSQVIPATLLTPLHKETLFVRLIRESITRLYFGNLF